MRASGTARRSGWAAGVLAVAAAVAVMAPVPAAADWPVYGHDLANSRDAGGDGPARAQLASLQPTWTFTSSGADFTGTPVLAGGILVAGNYAGRVYALSAVTGKVLWMRDLGQPVVGTAAIDVGVPGGPLVFVPVAQVGSPRLVALSLTDGSPRWDAVLIRHSGADVYGSPTFWRGSVYIGTSATNTDTSTVRGSVVALDERTGSVRWQTFTVPANADGAAVWSTPAIDPATGRLYAGTGNNYHPPATANEDSILALDAASGQILSHYQATSGDTFSLPDNPAGSDFDFGASPNLFSGPNGQQLVGAGQKSGIYWALDRATMQPVWRNQVGPGSGVGGFLGSTAYDGTRIYGAQTASGEVAALDRAGVLSWQSADSGGLHYGPTTVANGVLYTVDPSGALVARDPATGMILARLSLGGPSFAGVSAVGGALYAAVGTGPPPAPSPQVTGSGSIVAFGDTSRSGGSQLTAALHESQSGGRPGIRGRRVGRRHARRRAGRLLLRIRPRRARVGRRTRFIFSVSTGRGRPMAGALIRFDRRQAHTGPTGTARLAVRLRRRGRYVARAIKPGFRAARTTVRARRR